LIHKKVALLSWSGGKDSSLVLYHLRKSDNDYQHVEIKALLTTLTKDYNRISMHGVRRELLLKQARSIGIPVEEIWIPSKATNEIYQEQTIKAIMKWKETQGVSTIVFGDLFLQDIRAYREKFLGALGFECLFPLWGKETRKLAELFVESGFKAKICTIDPKKLNPSFCGREFDNAFLSELPNTVDPCGENGEFHTFVYEGPIFKEKVPVRVGQVVLRGGFYFADIVPGPGAGC
jgi:uncharacterized protein (TIGR00290 family)